MFKIEGTDSLLLLKLMNLAVGQLEVVDSFVYALEFVHDAQLCGRNRSMMKTRNEMGVFFFGIITVIWLSFGLRNEEKTVVLFLCGEKGPIRWIRVQIEISHKKIFSLCTGSV